MRKVLFTAIILSSIAGILGCGGSVSNTDQTTSSLSVTTVAGATGRFGSTDGIGSAARFNMPYGISTDGTNLYISDSMNSTIRKIVVSTRAVTTIAGSPGITGFADGAGSAALFNHSVGTATDGSNLFVADSDNDTIRKIELSTGSVTTIAGSPGILGSTDGVGSNALFYLPFAITTDGTNLYVTDANFTIRKITISSGTVTTIAGSPGLSGSADGIGSAARFNNCYGITTDGINLYVTDTDNNTIRKIVQSTGSVTTIAGSPGVVGSIDGTGALALFNKPYGLATDGTNLYVLDSGNNSIRKVVISSGSVTTILKGVRAVGITVIGNIIYTSDGYSGTVSMIQ